MLVLAVGVFMYGMVKSVDFQGLVSCLAFFSIFLEKKEMDAYLLPSRFHAHVHKLDPRHLCPLSFVEHGGQTPQGRCVGISPNKGKREAPSAMLERLLTCVR